MQRPRPPKRCVVQLWAHLGWGNRPVCFASQIANRVAEDLMSVRESASGLNERIREQVQELWISKEVSKVVAGGIGEEILEAGVRMAMAKEQSLLVLIKGDQSGEDWLDTQDVMQQTGVRVAPFPGSTRQDCAVSSRMPQLFQSAMKACGINASNLIEGIDDDARRSRSFEDAGFDWRCAKARSQTCQQRGFSCPWFG